MSIIHIPLADEPIQDYNTLMEMMDKRTEGYKGALAQGNLGTNSPDTNMAIQNARTKDYEGALRLDTLASEIDAYKDNLALDSSTVTNSVILSTNKGLTYIIIDAKIDVTKTNTLTDIALVNRRGKVKEHIQEDDYTVTINGSLISPERNAFPYGQLVLLNQILNEQRSIHVASAYLAAFGITKLVLKTADFKQSKLTQFSAMPIVLNCVSDKNYDFLVEDLL